MRVAFETFTLLRASGALGGGVGWRSRSQFNGRGEYLEDEDEHYSLQQLL